jgi:hypothetical protein
MSCDFSHFLTNLVKNAKQSKSVRGLKNSFPRSSLGLGVIKCLHLAAYIFENSTNYKP